MIPKDTIYIVDIRNPDDRFSFDSVPREMKISRGISITDINAISRNNPRTQFNSGSHKLSFQIDVWWKREQRDEVVNKVNWLTGLTYADDDGKYPVVKFVCGDLFLDYEWVIKTFNVNYTEFYEGNNYLPIQAIIDITLQLDTGNEDWRRTQIRDAQ